MKLLNKTCDVIKTYVQLAIFFIYLCSLFNMFGLLMFSMQYCLVTRRIIFSLSRMAQVETLPTHHRLWTQHGLLLTGPKVVSTKPRPESPSSSACLSHLDDRDSAFVVIMNSIL